MLVVFTDLDNCLLDHHTYSFEAALPALARLRAIRAPVVFTTSKTRAEVELWQQRMGVSHPGIVENGGAVILPDAPPHILGRPRAEILAALRAAAAETQAAIHPFADMPLDELAARIERPPEHARLAAAREYSEPFVLLSPGRENALREALSTRGIHLTRGGRFHHALAHQGKHAGVQWLLQNHFTPPVTSIGLGDAPNDEGFLALVQHPVRLRPPHTGPEAWNQAVCALLATLAG